MSNAKKYKHIFFDMDGTVTRTRSPIEDDMKADLLKLTKRGVDVIIISGQSVEAIQSQVGVGTFFMGQNGNHAVEVGTGQTLWHYVLSDSEKQEVLNHIHAMPHSWNEETMHKYVEDRESQIAYSIIGFKEDTAKKEAYDPGGAKRTLLLQQFPLISETVEVKIAGTTTLDYFKKGSHKGTNVAALIQARGWNSDDCIYVGDQLYAGGNDEVVIGVIETKEVRALSETQAFIRSQL